MNCLHYYLRLSLSLVFFVLMVSRVTRAATFPKWWSDLRSVSSLQDFEEKRNPNAIMGGSNNPCSPDTPFPCKTTSECIALTYVCDNSKDCTDGYDEMPEVCTAFKRPPVEEIVQFLASNKDWIMPNFFSGKDITSVAHALAVSSNIRDFRSRLDLSAAELGRLYKVLKSVEGNDNSMLIKYKMPMSAWQEVQIFFHRLLKSNFLKL